MKAPRVAWIPEKVDATFDQMKEDLGRVPSTEDVQKMRYFGLLQAIQKGRYPHAKTWNEYLRHRGYEPEHQIGKWNPESIGVAFDSTTNELGRPPTSEEFSDSFPGALVAIFSGRYENFKTWNDYLKYRGLKPNNELGKWTPEKVDRVFDEYRKELGRTPTQAEFTKKHGGAMSSITHGGYNPDVKTWGDYLDHRGVEKNLEYWPPEKTDSVVDKLKEKLGRNPTVGEVRGESWSAVASIQRRRYNPNVHSWKGYLIHRGMFKGKIKSSRQLSQILRTEQRAQYALHLVGGDEVDLADILVVVYEGRLTRKDVLEFAGTPTLKSYLSDFKKTSGVQSLIEAGKNLIPLDKNNVIRGIIFKRLRILRREILGPNPTQEEQQKFLDDLNKQLEGLAA